MLFHPENRKQARPGHWLVLSLLFAWLFAACAVVGDTPSTATITPAAATRRPGASATAPSASASATPGPQARDAIISYAVQPGDTLSGIAHLFGLQPKTVLWANYDQLRDNPDWLMLDMPLQILPVDGVYHQVGGGETLTSIASFFATEVQAIIDGPGNELSGPDPVIFNGQWLMIPGGLRLSRFRSMPNVARESAQLDIAEFGSGACPRNYSSDLVGAGQYAWPLSSRTVMVEGFNADWHPGLDLAAQLGEDVLAADDGVVVFSGWSNLGYGNLVMLDHGNGDFSLYAGLGQVLAVCGHAVGQGEVIGLAGISNHPAGAFVHFELRRGDQVVDPLDLLPSQ